MILRASDGGLFAVVFTQWQAWCVRGIRPPPLDHPLPLWLRFTWIGAYRLDCGWIAFVCPVRFLWMFALLVLVELVTMHHDLKCVTMVYTLGMWCVAYTLRVHSAKCGIFWGSNWLEVTVLAIGARYDGCMALLATLVWFGLNLGKCYPLCAIVHLGFLSLIC